MQQLVVDCQSGKISYVELSASEKTRRLQEIEKTREQEEAEKQIELKRRLVKELAELREMKLNPTLFTVGDVAEKQAIVDALQSSRSR